MKKVLILVEGQTEKKFVDNVLLEYFSKKNIFLSSTIVTTKKIKTGKNYKGGIASYQKVKNEVLNLLKDSSNDLVTTMFDLYGLPDDFPCFDISKSVKELEMAFEKNINSIRFKPFFVKYEFEGLLFSKSEEIANQVLNHNVKNELQKIEDDFNSPEDINNHPTTAPSKRIKKIIPYYDKVADGVIIAEKIGLDKIRKECKHFDEWIRFIEKI